ncbi:MAG: redox-sensing transcriptional repressor Rex [Firmicutes bacterium]|nr:redox-sensing transcriptional repressor Rex [Bacillota bacterium]
MKQLSNETETISSTTIASALGVHEVQVRKDLAMVSDGGKPKIGYVTKDLIVDIERFLGHGKSTKAVLVGVGNLGKSFLKYENFKNYGLEIVGAFDREPTLVGTQVGGIKVFGIDDIANFCKHQNVQVGIITVPAVCAQSVCDKLVSAGIRALWNFTPTNLRVPQTVIIKNEDMAASLAMLTRQL